MFGHINRFTFQFLKIYILHYDINLDPLKNDHPDQFTQLSGYVPLRGDTSDYIDTSRTRVIEPQGLMMSGVIS